MVLNAMVASAILTKECSVGGDEAGPDDKNLKRTVRKRCATRKVARHPSWSRASSRRPLHRGRQKKQVPRRSPLRDRGKRDDSAGEKVKGLRPKRRA